MFSFLSRWLARTRCKPLTEVVHQRSVPVEGIIAAEDDDFEWFWPPQTIADVAAWDKYWTDQIIHGLTPPLFDLQNHGETLVAAMHQNGMKSVLCAGNGISQEPRAFAEAGFDATALDPSVVAVNFARAWKFGPKDYELNMEPQPRREGGQIRFVVGDILDPTMCPGPFDVVIERRMLQLFEPERRHIALDALASRMKEDAILLSHTHYGNWRPGQDRTHPLQPLFVENGWTLWTPREGPKPPGRVASLFFSTG